MLEHSDYDIAQQRITEREKKKNSFYIWLFLTILIFLIGLLGGGRMASIFWPIGALIGTYVAGKGIQLYYESPQRRPQTALTNLEMSWLFGDDWQATTGTREYVFAQDRIRKRRSNRWVFLLHTIIFIFINLFIITVFYSYKDTNEPGGEWWLVVSGVWLIFYLRHGFTAFAPVKFLEKRERKLGQTLQFELTAMQSEKLKNDHKPKRDSIYRVGDDGELEEVENEINLSEDKPKRMMRDGEER